MSIETQSLVLLRETFNALRLGQPLTSNQAHQLTGNLLTREQKASALAGLALRSNLTPPEYAAAVSLTTSSPEVAIFVLRYDLIKDGSSTPKISRSDSSWAQAFKALLSSNSLGEELITELIGDIVNDSSTHARAAALMMVVCRKGMKSDDIAYLTYAMAHSGKIYDYRNEKFLSNSKLVRRYPTGALSEKTALILPALISCAREIVNVSSPFLVARSLGFTGGTWDKLKSIKEFQFPKPGEETLKALTECGIAMTVTIDEANPADRILYALRSVTGTIESLPLIISSIASKHICFPVNRLLMDVRYGDGAFMKDQAEANILGQQLSEVLNSSQVPTFFETTNTVQPTGCAIGNALEVAEAITVMANNWKNSTFDTRALEDQRKMVIHLFSLLMSKEFSEMDYEFWTSFALKKLQDNSVLNAFIKILIAHNVPKALAQKLIENPLSELELDSNPITIPPIKSGTLKCIDQKKLGEIVNSQLGGGGNEFSGSFDPKPGVLLQHRLGDQVNLGKPVCKLFLGKQNSEQLISELQSCFIVE